MHNHTLEHGKLVTTKQRARTTSKVEKVGHIVRLGTTRTGGAGAALRLLKDIEVANTAVSSCGLVDQCQALSR